VFTSEWDLSEITGAVRLSLSPTRLVKMIRGSHPGSRSGGVFSRTRSGPTPPIYPILMESVLAKPLILTPGMEGEVEEWLRTISGTWVHSQEEKYRVPADAWFAHIHHTTRQYKKLAGGLNSWNFYQHGGRTTIQKSIHLALMMEVCLLFSLY